MLRWREVEIHHLDLDLGYTAADWPPAFVADTLATELPALRQAVGDVAVPELPDHEVLAWLLGRPTRPDLPAVPVLAVLREDLETANQVFHGPSNNQDALCKANHTRNTIDLSTVPVAQAELIRTTNRERARRNQNSAYEARKRHRSPAEP